MKALLRHRKKLIGARRLRRRRYNYPSIQSEPKYYDTSRTATYLVADANMASLECPPASGHISTPAVGDSQSNRDGKKIVITQVEVKGVLYKETATTAVGPDPGNIVWVCLVLDTQTNGVELNSEDVWTNTNAAAFYQAPLRNLLFGTRFRVLKFKRYVMHSSSMYGASGSNWQSGVVRPFKMFKKLRLPVNFNAGTTASIANVQDNSLHVIAGCNQTSDVYMSYNARIRFIG